MSIYYIVLYADGTFMILANRPERSHHQATARFFETPLITTVADISNWAARGYPDDHDRFNKIGKDCGK